MPAHRIEWRLAQVDPLLVESLSNSLQLPPLLSHLLVARGVTSPEEAERFLSLSLQEMPDPALMADIDLAAKRLIQAAQHGEIIAIYGDYDVDGITSTALLSLFLREAFGVTPLQKIPHRLKDGYGLTCDHVRQMVEQKVQLLVTVDNGSSSVEEAKLARELGLDVIVIDHHQISEPEPDVVAHLNPHRKACQYPCKDLAAVGVVFTLISQVRRILKDSGDSRLAQLRLARYLDLVALGTVADVAPLRGWNRTLVRYGLLEMRRSPRCGLLALFQTAKLTPAQVTAHDLGFRLAPRLNAAGRLGDAALGLELILCEDPAQAHRLALQLEALNQERKAIEHRVMAQAVSFIESDESKKSLSALVLANSEWHFGVLGIVASRLVERFGRPAVLLSEQGGIWKGSARSVTGFDMKQALDRCSDLLVRYGGHSGAAGLSIEKQNFAQFETDFCKITQEANLSADFCETRDIDADVALSALSFADVEAFERLEPCGSCNPAPVLRALRARGQGQVKNEHLFIKFDICDAQARAVAWGQAEKLAWLSYPVDVIFTPRIESWGGQSRVVFDVLDLEPSQ